jgi:glutaconate CoA-transferase subunit B
MALEKRRFVEKIDFLTSIGFGDGSPGYRERAGVMGSGPYRVITHEALFGFDPQSHKMILLEIAPGKTPEQIQEKASFELLISPKLQPMQVPTAKDLRLLRHACDPEGYFLGRKIN